MKLEYKTVDVYGVSTDSLNPGEAKMIVAVFNNTDMGQDIIRPGAFAVSMAKKLPKGVWGHDWHTPVAKTLSARELLPGDPELPDRVKDLGGLLVHGAFNLDTQRGKEAYSDLKFGTIDEFSIGYIARDYSIDEQAGTRELKAVDWFEWSPVLAGMNPDTSIIDIKSLDKDGFPRVGSRLADRAESAIDDALMVVASMKSLWGAEGMRTKEGRTLNAANRDKIQQIHDRMSDVGDHAGKVRQMCKDLLDYTDPNKKSGEVTEEQKQAAFQTFMLNQARIRAMTLGLPQ